MCAVCLNLICLMFYSASCLIIIIPFYDFTLLLPCFVGSSFHFKKKQKKKRKQFSFQKRTASIPQIITVKLYFLFTWVIANVIGYCGYAVSEEMCNEVESLIFDLFANLGASGVEI